MATVVESPVSSDSAVRAYLLALKAGQKPESRPDISTFWASTIENAERAYTKSGGNPTMMERVFAGLCRDNPALADLFTAPPETGQKDEQQSCPLLPKDAYIDPLVSRGACAWLERYERFSRQASPEGADDSHVFCGVFALSVVAARRIFLPLGEEDIYPNFYFCLCADSTFFAKSKTAKIALSLLRYAGLGSLVYTSKKITAERLVSRMAGRWEPDTYASLSPVEQEKERNRLAFSGQKGMYYDEFGKLIKAALREKNYMESLPGALLELYDCPLETSIDTNARKEETAILPYLSILGAMTPVNMRSIATAGADSWSDGLLARCSFICPPPDAYKDDPLDIGRIPLPEHLVTTLQGWHDRLGVPELEITPPLDKEKGKPVLTWIRPLPQLECVVDPLVNEAWKTYRTAIKQLCREKDFPADLRANYGRLPIVTLKMAMLFASIENNNHIQMRHWAKAQELSEVLRRNLHTFYAQVNVPQTSATKEALLEEEIRKHLERHKALSLNTLRNSYMKKWSTKQVEDELKNMIRNQIVEQFQTSHATKYRLKEQEEDV